jgi:FAD/FMN-containing dehydrogenase
MATDPGDPAEAPRANYDHVGGEVERPDLVADLERLVSGDVRFDEYSRGLYATDASAYQVTPIGVVFPRSTGDVSAVVEYCAAREIPVLPRGGGTSLAGQAVNEAVVIDFTRHMNDVLAVNPEARLARVQAGVYLGDLNRAAAPRDLKFAPDPAYRDKSAIGGAIGNNSTGAHSLVYGKTDVYVESCEVVLADGTVTEFGEVGLDELRERADPDGGLEAHIYAEAARIVDEEAERVRDVYPDLKRNVSGYNLDLLIEEAESGSVNLARLLAGSEGTLAIVTEATVSLEPVPETEAIGLLTYDDLIDAMEDVAPILDHDPAAVEVLDDVLLDLARETSEFADVVGMLPEGTDSVLLVEFYAESDDEGREKIAGLLCDRAPGVEAIAVWLQSRPASSRKVGAKSMKETKSSTMRPGDWMPSGHMIASGMWLECSNSWPFIRGNGMPLSEVTTTSVLESSPRRSSSSSIRWRCRSKYSISNA